MCFLAKLGPSLKKFRSMVSFFPQLQDARIFNLSGFDLSVSLVIYSTGKIKVDFQNSLANHQGSSIEAFIAFSSNKGFLIFSFKKVYE